MIGGPGINRGEQRKMEEAKKKKETLAGAGVGEEGER